MLVEVDREVCVGAGQCVRAASLIFAQSEDDGLVVLRQNRPSDASQEDVRLAVGVCPSGAISVRASENE